MNRLPSGRDARPRVRLCATVLALAGCAAGTGVASVSAPSSDSAPASGGASSERLSFRPLGSVQGAPLGYGEYLPLGYGEPRPLLVFLHGGGEYGDGSTAQLPRILKLGILSLIETDDWPSDRPFIVLMPQYPPAEAEACELADEVEAFLKFAVDHYEVDMDRVYLTGVSCGGIGLWDYLASHTNELVAATVPIAAHTSEAFERTGCELGRVPIWAFHGGARRDRSGDVHRRADPRTHVVY
jgi:predicted peptidase